MCRYVALILSGLAWAAVITAGCGRSESGLGAAPAGAAAGPRLEASPNPVPAGAGNGTTTIKWATGGGRMGEEYLSKDGGPEKLFTKGTRGSREAKWIATGAIYRFRLYVSGERTTPLAEVEVVRAK